MSGELSQRGGFGAVVPFDPEADLNVATIGNYHDRGRKAGFLVLAAVTESMPLAGVGCSEMAAYLDDGEESSAAVQLYAVEEERSMPAEIERALFVAQTLQSYLSAQAPGTSKVSLESFDTRYEKIWKNLIPGRRDNESQRAAFGDAMMDTLRDGGLPLQHPDQAQLVIRRAPKSVTGLRLTDYNGYSEGRHEVVTTLGRLVAVHGDRPYGKTEAKYWLPYETGQVRERGGRTPDERKVNEMRQRIVSLRTSGSKR